MSVAPPADFLEFELNFVEEAPGNRPIGTGKSPGSTMFTRRVVFLQKPLYPPFPPASPPTRSATPPLSSTFPFSHQHLCQRTVAKNCFRQRATRRVYLYVTHTSSIIPTKTMQPILEIQPRPIPETVLEQTGTVQTSDCDALDRICLPSVHSPSVSRPTLSSPVLLQPSST